MNRDEKAAVVEELASQIKEAEALIAVDYRGISVTQAAELRAKLRDAGASFRIVKNSLTERAAESAGADGLKPLLEGPTALTFVSDDAAVAAKALASFSRANGVLEFKGGLMGAEALEVDQLQALARLPAREVMQGQFVGVLASPLTTLVRGLGLMVSGLAVALKQIAEQGLVSGEAPAAEEAPADEEEEAPAEEAAPTSEEPEPDDSPAEGQPDTGPAEGQPDTGPAEGLPEAGNDLKSETETEQEE